MQEDTSTHCYSRSSTSARAWTARTTTTATRSAGSRPSAPRSSATVVRVLVALVCLLVSGCASNQIQVVAELGAPVDIQIGEERLTLAKSQLLALHEGRFAAGTRLVARVNGAVIEELTLAPEHVGHNLVWNVKGSSPLHAVDYTGVYGPDNKAVPGGPFKLLASLEGKSLWVAPDCQLVNVSQPLPRTRIGVIPVVRVVRVPKESVVTTLDDALKSELGRQLDVHGRLEFGR